MTRDWCAIVECNSLRLIKILNRHSPDLKPGKKSVHRGGWSSLQIALHSINQLSFLLLRLSALHPPVPKSSLRRASKFHPNFPCGWTRHALNESLYSLTFNHGGGMPIGISCGRLPSPARDVLCDQIEIRSKRVRVFRCNKWFRWSDSRSNPPIAWSRSENRKGSWCGTAGSKRTTSVFRKGEIERWDEKSTFFGSSSC